MILFTLALLQLGCSSSKNQVEEEALVEPEQLLLSVQLESDSAVAGQDLSYQISLTNENNEAQLLSEWQMTSAEEVDLFWNAEKIRPTIAGTHELTVDLIHEGIEYTASASLLVTPAAVDVVDLLVDSYSAEVGESIVFQTTAEDRYGNPVESVDIDVSVNSANLSVTETQLYSTMVDLYTITASVGDVQDIEHVEFVAGSATNISLLVPTTDVELNESLHCTVVVEDQYGNQTEDDWTLWVDGSGNSAVSGSSVTFLEEGLFTIYAEVADTSLVESYGPILVDSSGPTLSVDTPSRGEWSTSSNTTITGNVVEEYSSLSTLTVNGSAVSPDGSGDFSTTQSNDFGVNLFETQATDTDGNTSTDTRSILMGDFWPKDLGIDDAVNVYIGSTGMQTLEDYAYSTVSNINISDFLPSNPVAQQSVIGCNASINLYNVTYSGTDLDVNPNSDGTITVTFTVYNMSLYADVPLTGGSWWNPCPDFSGDVSANSIVASVIVEPSVSNHQLSVNINSSSASVNGLDVDLDGWTSILNFVVNFFEDDLSQMLEDELITVVEDQIPPLLEDILQALELSESFEVLGNTYTLSADPSSVAVDDNGINLGLRANVSAANWLLSDTGEGSLFADYSPPSFPSNSSVNIGLSVDVINQLLYQVWGGGSIGQELTLSELGLDSDELDLLFPGATDLRVTIEPLLPPVAVPDGNDLELQIGDLYIALHNGAYATNDIRMELFVHVFSDLQLSASASSISATLGTTDTYFDVVYPQQGSSSAASVLEELVPLLLPSLTEAIGSIELPSFQDFSITNVSSSLSGGQLQLSGTLSN